MTEQHPREWSLPTVRRFEAAAFRAWPAATVEYDGTWLTRLTAGHPAKRLNSVNPLDPGDDQDLERRIARAARRFRAYGRPLTFRISPLAGDAISTHLDAAGWSRFGESLVMRVRLDTIAFDESVHQIPLRDIGRYVSAAIRIGSLSPDHQPGLTELVGSIAPEVGLFVTERTDAPVATTICVHDGDLAGLFEVATRPGERNAGHGRQIVLSALNWARRRGARFGWLQVEAANAPAVALYASIGFEEIYRYVYRRPPEERSEP